MLAALLLVACAGRSVSDGNSPSEGSSGSPSVGTGGATGGGSGRGGGGGTGGMREESAGRAGGGEDTLLPGGFPRCGKRDAARAADCDGIDRIRPLDPSVSAMVDGSIQIGEFGGVSVWVENGTGRFVEDVCVGFVVDQPEIELTPDGFDQTHPRHTSLFAEDTSIVGPANLRVGGVEPGTIAHFTAYVTFDGTDCVGPTASVDALVRDGRYYGPDQPDY